MLALLNTGRKDYREPRYIMLLRAGALDIDATDLGMTPLLMIEEITITKLNLRGIFLLIFDTTYLKTIQSREDTMFPIACTTSQLWLRC